MRFMVSGDLRTAFTIEVEADSEEVALAKVQAMGRRAIELEASLAETDVSLDYAEVVDDG